MKRVATVALLAVSMVPFAAQPAAALAAYIHVNTTSDADAADGYCSLREAIYATNNGAGYRECEAGTTGTDTILLDVSPINVTSELPPITVPIKIDSNLGGPRAEIHGPGSITTTGLNLQGSGASSVRDLVIDHFGTAIHSFAATLTIAGNVVGPNSGYGIEVTGGTVTIGGSNSGSPNPCSGDCNIISGNPQTGISWATAAGTITGNFIGVDATGTAASANGTGISISSGNLTIGGTTPAERNVVSGNTTDGMFLNSCVCYVYGNYVGTNAAGNAAVANGATGITSQNSQVSIGAAGGSGNLISGNHGDAIFSSDAVSPHLISVYGNKIGTKAGGGALGNGGDGIHFTNGAGLSHVQGAAVGDGTASGSNTIAYNTGAGVQISGFQVDHNHISGNSIHDNAGLGIQVDSSANDSIIAPGISGASPVHGIACASCIVQVYSDSANEGRIFEGTATADGSGNWSYSGSISGPNVTATATDATGNTSQFSAPATVAPPKRPDGRIRKGSGSLIGNNIYNTTGLNQTKSGSAAPGYKVKFGISIQNDSSVSDQFKLAATGTSVAGYTIKYFHGTTDVTSAVVAGTYTTPALAAGGTWLITAKVKVTSSAATGSSVTRLATITSVGDATKKDAVKFIAKRL